jgi:hypothetical protein
MVSLSRRQLDGRAITRKNDGDSRRRRHRIPGLVTRLNARKNADLEGGTN